MTESPFPFGAVEQQAPVEDDSDGGSRRNLVALGALAAVVLGGGAFFLLGGSDETLDDVAFTPRAPRVASPVTPTATPAKLPVATKVPLGRNPFRALYVQPAAAAAPVSAPVTAPVTTPVTVTPVTTTPVAGTPIVVIGPGSPPAPAPAPTSTETAKPAPAPAPKPGPEYSTVSLTGVKDNDGTPVGRFVYDGTKLTGSPGDVMGGKLLLISLQQDVTGKWFANLRLGDGSPFEVFQGQTVVVQ